MGDHDQRIGKTVEEDGVIHETDHFHGLDHTPVIRDDHDRETTAVAIDPSRETEGGEAAAVVKGTVIIESVANLDQNQVKRTGDATIARELAI